MTWPIRTAVVAMVIGCLASGTAEARGAREHEGFFLRLGLGGGYGDSKSRLGKNYLAIRGATLGSEMAIGGTIASLFALHLTVMSWQLPNPRFSDDGTGNSEWGDDHDVTVTLPFVGLGITRYLMPQNVFISGSVGAGSMVLSRAVTPGGESWPLEGGQEEGGSTHAGLAIRLQGGKEWWVSDEWGLGASVVLDYFHLPDKMDGVLWQTTFIGAMFSATFN